MSPGRHVDVLVVGAGLSGIDAGYRLQQMCPDLTYRILEAREEIGGTWDLFRYPGVRSDSDMFTLGYPFRPWPGSRGIASGGRILEYIRQTADRSGVAARISTGHRVQAAEWSTQQARWSVHVRTPEGLVDYTCSFLYLCCGYYDYEQGHSPRFPGMDTFAGRILHPQFWPPDLDLAGRRIVVVGSGATAVTLVPALAPEAAHVVMLQRSPTYVVSLPASDPVGELATAVLPPRAAYRLIRWRNAAVAMGMYQLCRRFPDQAKRWLVRSAAEQLPPDADVARDFTPTYPPWDQRLCIAPDGDFFQALSAGGAEVVTDTIERFDPTGLVLTSGRHLDADVVVLATGLRIQVAGGIRLSIDGQPVDPSAHLVYRGLMLDGVPNLAWCVGYTNASWTLRADLSSRYVCRVLRHMRRHGYRSATPACPPSAVPQPVMGLEAGYLVRARDELPQQAAADPWVMRQNYLLDLPTMRFGRLTRDVRFA